jgi:hypothetical protein
VDVAKPQGIPARSLGDSNPRGFAYNGDVMLDIARDEECEARMSTLMQWFEK